MALSIDSYVLGPAATNCYVVRADGAASDAIVIDPGTDELELGDLRCAAILITHGDIDHIGGVADLAERTGAPVYGPARDRMPPERMQWLPFRDYTVDVELDGGETLDLAGLSLDVLAIPGHSRDHLAFAVGDALFSGDLLFANSVGRTDIAGGDWHALVESARSLFDTLPPETTVYPGHGPATTLGDERDSNPFLAELRA